MTKRTHTIVKQDESHNQIWEWEETPALVAALQQLEVTTKKANEYRN